MVHSESNSLEQIDQSPPHDLQLEFLQNKLFYPYTPEGETNMEFYLFLKEVDEFLMTKDGYVCVAPVGSQTKGYANEGSDFDIMIIGFDAIITNQEKIVEEIKEIAKKYGRDAGVPFFYTKNYFESNLSPESNSERQAYYYHVTWPLLYPLMGRQDQINELRRLAKVKYDIQEKDDPENYKVNYNSTIDNVLYWDINGAEVDFKDGSLEVQNIVLRDQHTVKKMRERGWGDDEIKGVVIARAGLWRERLDKLLKGEKLDI